MSMTHGPDSTPPTASLEVAWAAAGPLSPLARRRREEMLRELHGELAGRRRRRVAVRVGLTVVVLVAGAGLVRMAAGPAGRPAEVARGPAEPAPRVAVGPVVRPGEGPAEGSSVRGGGSRIVTVSNDPGVLARFEAPRSEGRIVVVDDAGVLKLLERAGSPGLIEVDGRVILSRDLSGRGEGDGDPGLQPRSRSGEGPDRGRA